MSYPGVELVTMVAVQLMNYQQVNRISAVIYQFIFSLLEIYSSGIFIKKLYYNQTKYY